VTASATPGEPILAIDFGTSYSGAIVVTPRGRPISVPDPVLNGPAWPSAVFAHGQRLLVGEDAKRRQGLDLDRYREEFKRELGAGRPVELGGRRFELRDLVTAVIRALKTAAEETLHASGETDGHVRLGRTVLTIPASYEPGDPRRALMITAAEAAGLGPVQLLSEPAAAAYAVPRATAGVEPETVLVYDFGGGTFDAALVKITPLHERVLDSAFAECGGSDLDTCLAARLQADADSWLAAMLAAVPPGQQKQTRDKADAAFRTLAQTMKHHLSQAGDARGQADLPGAQLSHLTYADLTREAAPLLDETVACCADLLSRNDLDHTQLDAILLVGGTTRIPAVEEALRRAFPGVEMRRPLHPQLAVVEGAATWASRYPVQEIEPRRSRDLSSVLRWELPGSAEFQGWLVQRDQRYSPGTVLALVRLADGTLWQLTASQAGRLDQLLVHQEGEPIISDQWLATTTRA
jgi:molecular chaperone DnaK (HSP70)